MPGYDTQTPEDEASGIEQPGAPEGQHAPARAPEPLVVQLAPDRLHLLVYLAPSAPDLPAERFVALILEQCARLPLERPITASAARECRRACHAGTWTALASGLAARPPRDSYIEFFIPLSLSTENELGRSHRHAVRAGTPLARLHPGQPGAAGRDLCGTEIAVREPGEARLPRGDNTCLSDDGLLLLAACDGEVLLHDLLVHVRPLRVLDGADIALDAPLLCTDDLFIRGTVGTRRRIETSGDIHIEGHVYEAHLRSTGGSITVHGSVSGERAHHSILEASTDITCGTALHATLRAGNDVHLLTRAHASAIEALGAVHLRHSITESLHDVELRVWGGLISAAPLAGSEAPAPTERQHTRVPVNLAGEVALHGAIPLAFYPCVIEDLSVSGARCRLEPLPPSGPPAQGTLLQLRFMLPVSAEYILIVGRVARFIAPGVSGIIFVEAPQRDLIDLFCARTLRERPDVTPGSPAERANRGAGA